MTYGHGSGICSSVLLHELFSSQKTSYNVRLGMINNPSAALSSETSRVARAVWAAMQTQSANNAKNFITKMAKDETAAALGQGVDIGQFSVGVREDASLI